MARCRKELDGKRWGRKIKGRVSLDVGVCDDIDILKLNYQSMEMLSRTLIWGEL